MRAIFFAAGASLLAGCASAPPVVQAGPDPADAAAPTSVTIFAPATAGTVDYRPVEPTSWIERNERVSPAGRRRR